MDAKDAIRSAAGVSKMVLETYLSDLDDSDLMRRPAPGCNHIAYQLGHLISSEAQLLEMAAPGQGVKLPEGFAAAHSKENADNDDPASFHDKATYLKLSEEVRQARFAALESYPESELDNEAPEAMRSFCPTMGDLFMLIATHPLMHAGQFVIVRRQLGKPVLM